MSVRRYDRAILRIDQKKLTQQGYLLCDAMIARTGVQIYRQPDGTQRREYRPPEEVFHADALASFGLAPLTLGHPPVPLTAENTAQYQKGIVAGPTKEDRFVRATVQVMQADAIAAATAGEAAELSCGYECDLEDSAGVAPDGQKYDAIQRNIRGNHVALVKYGRAGPDVRLRMDAADAEQETPINPHTEPGNPAPPKEKTVVKITIDGIQCEVSELAAELYVKQRKADDDKRQADAKAHADALAAADAKIRESAAALVAQKTETDKQAARADQADKAKDTAEKARKDAEDPKRMDAAVAARVEIVSKARAVLGNEAKTDGKDAQALKREVLTKLDAETKLDGKSEAYIDAAFDIAFASFQKVNPAAAARAGVIDPPKPGARADDGEPKDPRDEFMKNKNKVDANDLPGMRQSDLRGQRK